MCDSSKSGGNVPLSVAPKQSSKGVDRMALQCD